MSLKFNLYNHYHIPINTPQLALLQYKYIDSSSTHPTHCCRLSFCEQHKDGFETFLPQINYIHV